VFERLKEALDAVLDAATPASDSRDVIHKMHEAVVETRVALDSMRDGIAVTERRLAVERKHLDDAERRGRMAAEIGDQETAQIAEQYTAKHGERLLVLEHKLTAEREEFQLAEREFNEMREKLRRAREHSPSDTSGRIESAWRDIEAAGGTRPETDLNDELLRSKFDRAASEARAEEQLRQLKKKMGR
jgi:HAMP domain-containing protein